MLLFSRFLRACCLCSLLTFNFQELYSAMSSEEGKHFTGGLIFNTDEQALEDHFSSVGPLSEVVVVRDWKTQRSQGFVFITFNKPRACPRCDENREWMGDKSMLTVQASVPGEPEGVRFWPMSMVATTLEVVETIDMEVEDMTVDLEDMDMGMGSLETTVAARVDMTTTQEEITETIMTTEMGHAHKT